MGNLPEIKNLVSCILYYYITIRRGYLAGGRSNRTGGYLTGGRSNSLS